MKLQRLKTDNLNFAKLDEMITAMKGLLEHSSNSSLALEELLTFQECDGSFKLLDSYDVPSDVRIDYCHMPTYIGAAILMRELLAGRAELNSALEKALTASLHRQLFGHGYDAEKGCIEAINIFIKGGLNEFLETQRKICPEFHQKVHNILHEYNSRLIQNQTIGVWGEDYRNDWQKIVDKLKINKRLYLAYGSNIYKPQMKERCSDALVIGKTYLEDWDLTIPFYANIEPTKSKKTPALVWEITAKDESSLDICEGYPYLYDKTQILIDLDGSRVAAMAYVMTDTYKTSKKKPRDNYKEQIINGYIDAGFSDEEFQPRI